MRILWRWLGVGRVAGVPVRVHTTWLLFPAGAIAWLGWRDGGLRGVAAALGFLAILVACLLVHEFAHVAAGALVGSRTRRVLLIPFGCVADMESLPPAPYEIGVALAGPAASLALAGCAWGVGLLAGGAGPGWVLSPASLAELLAPFNLAVAAFNLLPLFPMDGGRVLRSTLAILLGLGRRRASGAARLLATRIAVRYVAWPGAAGAVAATILWTHFWPHLLLAALLLVAAELEYAALRESPALLDPTLMVTIELVPLEDSASDARPLSRAWPGFAMVARAP